MSFLKDYPQIKVLQKLAKKNKVSIHLVGGFLRDHRLNIEKKDLDFAVSSGSIDLAKRFAKEIKGAFVLLDDERCCARVVKKTKDGIFTFDLADYRAKTFKGDLAHRDFTINTLSVDILEIKDDTDISCIIKDYKKATEDIDAKIVRMTSIKVFKEDPLRIMRAFSLKATLGFKIERDTLKQIKVDVALLLDVSYERIRDELFKILGSDRTSVVLKDMHKIGLLEVIIPQIKVMFKCDQGKVFHHLDVWGHSLETVVQVEKLFLQMKDNADVVEYISESLGGDRKRYALIKLAALLHDIGKPDSKRKLKGRLAFHGHENIGKRIVKYISRMMKISIRERHALEDMVQWHLRPGYLSNFKKPSEKAVYRFFRDTKEEAASVLLLSLSDQRATRGPMTTANDQIHHEKICLTLLGKYFEKQKEEPFVCLINGDDIIRKLKLKPAPIFTKILTEVAEQQVLGKIKTKKEALALAKNMGIMGKEEKM